MVRLEPVEINFWGVSKMRGSIVNKGGKTYVNTRAFLAALFLCSLLVANSTWAQQDDDEPVAKAPANVDRARRKMYLGGRDEQDLKVQPTLPQPSRYPDGAAASAEGEAAPTVPGGDTD
jgi:hypothetical protein